MTHSPLRRSAALILVLAGLGACAVAPGTGRTIFTGGMTPEEEAAIGFQENEKVLAQFGGAYEDPDLTRYVSSLGGLLARTSELPNLKFTFTVLDTPMVNAFALPGGYVYVTRGLLALANNEAQLAGVLAHEIGHVTARHAAERYGQATLAQGGAVIAGLLLGDLGAQAAGGGAMLALSSWSRDQEFEADKLGVRYLSRAGFDPGAMAGFLGRLQAHGRLQAKLAGQKGKADQFSLLQTHPRTADRVEQAMAQAGVKRVADPIVARDVYLRQIDGIVFGDSLAQGVIKDRRFLHPALGFAFEVPEGFTLVNTPALVRATGPKGAAIIFDRAGKKARGRDPFAYLTRTWAKKVKLKGAERITINGMAAATGRVSGKTKEGKRDFRLVAVRAGEDIYRFTFMTRPSQTAVLAEPLKRTTYSFRRLSQAEAAAIKPLRLRLVRVQAGDTPSRLAGRMAVEKLKLDHFLVLNGLDRNSRITAGQRVKIVTE